MSKGGNKNPETWNLTLKMIEQKFFRELKQFRRLVKIWRSNKSQLKIQSNQANILLQYAAYLEGVNNSDRLKSPFYIKPIRYQQQMNNVESQKQIFLGIGFLQKGQWGLNFNKIFLQKLKLLSEQNIVKMFLKLYIMHQGYLNFREDEPDSLKACQGVSRFVENYYTVQMQIDQDIYYMLVSIGVHQIPHYNFHAANEMRIEWFRYAMMITCEDLIHNFTFYNQKKMKNIIDNLQNNYEESPRSNFQRQILCYDDKQMDQKLIYFHSKKRDNQHKNVKIYPTVYKRVVPNELCLENFAFMIEKFQEYQIRIEYLNFTKEQAEEKLTLIEYEERQEYQNQQMIKDLQIQTAKNRKTEFQSHSKILNNLEKIPNFKYNLTIQQRKMLCQSGNLIIVGRSGTGKTTCAMLRLYGVEFNIKLKECNSLKKQGLMVQSPSKCMMMMLDEIQIMKNIIITFSGILIDEIKKQYDDMIYQIKEKHAEICQICKKTFKGNKVVEEEYEDPIDKLKRQEQQQQKKVVSLDQIKNNEFPGFFTIQNFIRIIDKTIARPFYSQDKAHDNLNDKNAIIKHAFINSYKYQSKGIHFVDTKKAVYVDYNFFAKHIWDKLPKQLTKPTKEYCLLTPSIVCQFSKSQCSSILLCFQRNFYRSMIEVEGVIETCRQGLSFIPVRALIRNILQQKTIESSFPKCQRNRIINLEYGTLFKIDLQPIIIRISFPPTKKKFISLAISVLLL